MVTHLCSQNGTDGLVLFVKGFQFLQREAAAYICMQDKDLGWITSHEFISKVVKSSSCSECLIFAKVSKQSINAPSRAHAYFMIMP